MERQQASFPQAGVELKSVKIATIDYERKAEELERRIAVAQGA
jgi:hypothetical protein